MRLDRIRLEFYSKGEGHANKLVEVKRGHSG